MDLSQTKLSKSEWNSIEVSVGDAEKRILQLILDGYVHPDIRHNLTTTLISHVKIPPSDQMDWFLYREHFDPLVKSWTDPPPAAKRAAKLHPVVADIRAWKQSLVAVKIKPPSKADMIRIQNTMHMIQSQRHLIYEFILLDFCKEIVAGTGDPWFYLYTLIQFKEYTIAHVNRYVQALVDAIVGHFDPASAESVAHVFQQSYSVIEKNPYLIKHEDMRLYPHQQQLFRLFRRSPHAPKLVLYMAPTGTGKTLSPIGLSCGHRVIFVCVARHVGLALAKSAISVEKRVAFAFGCETASDIRLHYFAAAEYQINKRSGGIGKVDNSVGDKVEIMICDVASYLVAMHYMLAFNDESRIVTYWDEPTITMDYESHELHATIHRNWAENKISKMVLSCATLPKEDEIAATLYDFRQRFAVKMDDGDDDVPLYGYQADADETVERTPAEIHTIDSFDCKKSIAIIDKDTHTVMPHVLFEAYRDVLHSVDHCEENKTLLRYLDVREIVRLVEWLVARSWLDAIYHPSRRFKHVKDVHLTSIKEYYLDVLRNLDQDKWGEIHRYMKQTQTPRFSTNAPLLRKTQSADSSVSSLAGQPLARTNSVAAPCAPVATNPGILLTTKDAHTLTDGPAIFLAEDVDKIGKFYIQQTNLPESIFLSILEKIERNNAIQKHIGMLERQLDDRMQANTAKEGGDKKGKKNERTRLDKESTVWMDQIAALRENIQSVHLPALFIPNTKPHQGVWLPANTCVANAFVPRIDETDVREIMGLEVDTQKKLLLILGIGVFSAENPLAYMEIMKRLAYDQRLFLIIASSDYIYGTNYQFCHGFIGKDLTRMTQQKTIQAIGRIGRNNIQQEYTVRFRDDLLVKQLFQRAEVNQEAVVMNRLFTR